MLLDNMPLLPKKLLRSSLPEILKIGKLETFIAYLHWELLCLMANQKNILIRL